MAVQTDTDTKSLNLLGAIRQSKHRKGFTADTSPELQRKHIDRWADSNGHHIVDVAIDLNVSGSKVAAWNRPDLGRWLRERSDEFDGIVIDSLDRAGRDVEAFLRFQSEYLAPLGKSLHFVSPDIDLSTAEGRMVAINLMAVAEFQARQLADKMRDVSASVRGKGQHAGGPAPYGYVAAKLPEPGFGYEIDPLDGWIARKMVDRYLAGNSMCSIARWLNLCGIPSAFNGKLWARETVKYILKSPAIAGIMTKAGKRADGGRGRAEPLLDTSGEMVRMRGTDGIATLAEWQAIRQAMTDNGRSGPRSNGGDLLHVARCGKHREDGPCGQWLYSAPQTTHGKTYRYMKCARKIRVEVPGECSNPVANAELVKNAISRIIVRELGSVLRRAKPTVSADDMVRALRAELKMINKQIAGLAEQLISGKMSPELAGTAERGLIANREKRQNELRELTKHEKGDDWESWPLTGDTYGQYWESLDWAARHAFLVEHSITADVVPEKDMDAPHPVYALLDAMVLGEDTETDHDRYLAEHSWPAGKHRVIVNLGDLEKLRGAAALAA
jgi:site-specific DNA recombinase